MSYQPEERYWTDYLRIAFPVLGLLLLLGLFWFWATELIDNNDEPNGTTVSQTTLTAGPSSTAGSGEGTDPELTAETIPSGDSEPTAASEPKATRTPRDPTEEPENVGQFAEDDIVVTIAEANLRSSPALEDDNVVTTVAEGTEMTVTGPSVRADGYIWVPVVDTETGDQDGYLAEETLEASE